MGSPLAAFITNLLMEHVENEHINSLTIKPFLFSEVCEWYHELCFRRSNGTNLK